MASGNNTFYIQYENSVLYSMLLVLWHVPWKLSFRGTKFFIALLDRGGWLRSQERSLLSLNLIPLITKSDAVL